MQNATKWTFKGSLTDFTTENIPFEIIHFLKLRILEVQFLQIRKKNKIHADNSSMSLAQCLMHNFVNDRKMKNKDYSKFSLTKEFPFQMEMGLTIHKLTRSKKLVNILHERGISVPYIKVLEAENDIAKYVLKKMEDNNGVYIPSDIVAGKFIHFAVDNIDFNEDTCMGP